MKPTITSHGVTFVRPTADEKTEQHSIQNLVVQIGGVVYTLGSKRQQYCAVCGSRTTDQGTRQTPGLSDLLVFLPPAPRQRADTAPWIPVWIEVKGRGGVLSVEQVAFREINTRAGVAHLVGGVDAVVQWLTAGGWIR